MLCNGDKASDQCPFLSSDRYCDIVLSQVGLKACQTRGRHSLNEWDYALPARPTGSCPILRAAGDVEGKTVLNIKKGDILGMQVMA